MNTEAKFRDHKKQSFVRIQRVAADYHREGGGGGRGVGHSEAI